MSYEEEPLWDHHYIQPENRSLSETWRSINLETGKNDAAVNMGRNVVSASNNEHNVYFTSEHFSKRRTCVNHKLQASLVADVLNSSSSSSSPVYEAITTCNTCKPATINRESESEHKNSKLVTSSLHESEPPMQVHTKHRGPLLSWLFPRSKKNPKPEMSPNPIESEDMAQLLKEWGLLSLESLKKELLEANTNRDAALAEVSEMRSSLGELQQKLISLEIHCEELKKALKQTQHAKNDQVLNRLNLSTRTKSSGGIKDDLMPVSHEVMVEGFLQMVSETRLSIKHFCKMLIHQIEETDCNLMEKLNLLQPHRIASSNKYSKALTYHIVEALINQSMYQDFENCVFQQNGSPKFLDPRQDRQENFSSFISLRNLSWNEVLCKGTKSYSEEFSRFCDRKMSCIVSLLNCWSRAWPEQLLQCFFVAAKCIWLLHLLAFSFSPPPMILRVEEDQNFDPLYMEEILLDRKRAHIPARVKTMVVPGFYIEDRVLRCRVLCRY
ncbi:hypothetical protein GW17_00026941 [Ensete ventricosum]|nr:hypothetical protein GW17_00026941 [Ensete ventricosum]